MARVPFRDRSDLPDDAQAIHSAIAASRSGKVGNIWRGLLNAPGLTNRILQLADELRHHSVIDPKSRELAVMMVGHITKCAYEFDHHWNAARKAGISKAQLESLEHFETSDLFTPRERAILRFARESTERAAVSDATWQDLKQYFDDRQAVEMVMTVAWYNAVVRILLGLDIENEPGFKRVD